MNLPICENVVSPNMKHESEVIIQITENSIFPAILDTPLPSDLSQDSIAITFNPAAIYQGTQTPTTQPNVHTKPIVIIIQVPPSINSSTHSIITITSSQPLF